ncbi:EF hand [Anatilimnocola aggregata]|uniref:EF hand n=1 Tax=Anatilimnocola aggregata TaxID=2528021 RepID=A0A517Y9V7_9BACT|nr:hypothetical protein [Anatilimnocola aggregata]QDU27016.1 EF hand [Anatilimnocola aggregata]
MKSLSLFLFSVCALSAATTFAQAPKGPPNPATNPVPNNPAQNPNGQFGQPFNPGAGAQNAAAVREAMMKRFDRNGDGRLDQQEQLAATKAMQQQGIRVPGAPNLVGPGKNAGPQAGPGLQAPQPQQPPAPKLNKREELLLKRFDKDGDGKLNNEEKAAARAELGQKNKTDKK